MFFRVLIICILSGLIQADEKGVLVDKDRAIFRLEGRVVFLSEINHLRSQIEVLYCLGNSFLLETTGFVNKKYQPISHDTSLLLLREKKPELDRLMNLYKALLFANKRDVSIERSLLTSLETKKCLEGNWDSWGKEVKSLLQAEIFYQERFKGKEGKDSLKAFLQENAQKFKHEFFL